MLMFAYNLSKHSTTQQMPFLLAWGWAPRGPHSRVRQAATFKSLGSDVKSSKL
jgi:hypothetical protein